MKVGIDPGGLQPGAPLDDLDSELPHVGFSGSFSGRLCLRRSGATRTIVSVILRDLTPTSLRRMRGGARIFPLGFDAWTRGCRRRAGSRGRLTVPWRVESNARLATDPRGVAKMVNYQAYPYTPRAKRGEGR